tara:strand:- start:64 stop:231 length:168 start_codon:yes stop_codon:yes gene_type:complete
MNEGQQAALVEPKHSTGEEERSGNQGCRRLKIEKVNDKKIEDIQNSRIEPPTGMD